MSNKFIRPYRSFEIYKDQDGYFGRTAYGFAPVHTTEHKPLIENVMLLIDAYWDAES